MVVRIGFIHIGKTGGTAVKTAFRSHLKSINTKSIKKTRLKLLAHRWTLKKVARHDVVEQVVFFIREPTDRFISAFNSRLRQGQPRHNTPWSAREKIVFARFKTPNQLAEALNSWNPFRRRAAKSAMMGIKHCRMAYAHYLDSVGLLRKQKNRIAFIGEQEHLDRDFEHLKKLLELGDEIKLPTGDVEAHRSPVDLDKYLSKRARRNLKRYYRKDYKIYAWCKAHKERLLLANSERNKESDANQPE